MENKEEKNSSNYDFSSEIQIDPDALDIEWLMQPQVFLKYAELCVNAEMKYDRAKEKLEFVRASLDSEIRSNPIAFTGVDKKPTEAQINSIILKSDDYKQKLSLFNSRKRDFKLLSAAVKAFEQRKSALENLVKLHGQSYFASPNSNSERTLGDSYRETMQKRSTAEEKVKRRMDLKENPESTSTENH